MLPFNDIFCLKTSQIFARYKCICFKPLFGVVSCVSLACAIKVKFEVKDFKRGNLEAARISFIARRLNKLL